MDNEIAALISDEDVRRTNRKPASFLFAAQAFMASTSPPSA
jgi:hypothetical protein